MTPLEDLAAALGGRGEEGRAEASEWLRQASIARFDRDPFTTTSRDYLRALIEQKLVGVVIRLADLGRDLAFAEDHRQVVARAFAQSFDGPEVDGPAWRLSPTEDGRPTYAEWLDANGADFS